MYSAENALGWALSTAVCRTSIPTFPQDNWPSVFLEPKFLKLLRYICLCYNCRDIWGWGQVSLVGEMGGRVVSGRQIGQLGSGAPPATQARGGGPEGSFSCCSEDCTGCSTQLRPERAGNRKGPGPQLPRPPRTTRRAHQNLSIAIPGLKPQFFLESQRQEAVRKQEKCEGGISLRRVIKDRYS